VFICSFVGFISCEKEPQKGKYKGEFTGQYVDDTMSYKYSTIYYFEVTRSTKKELRLMEKQSQITSILHKHKNDSISGMIGFGSVFKPNENISSGFNIVKIYGKYDKTSIYGKFSTTFTDGNKEYVSEGDFKLRLY
jgi:hypothetical protein